jgi:hypothetical protein
MNICTQLGAVNIPSYLSQIKSDLHKTFSVCQDCSPELIKNVYGGAHVTHLTHLTHMTHVTYVIHVTYLTPVTHVTHVITVTRVTM